MVDDRTGLIAARASIRVDVCPLTKTIVGFAFTSKPFSSARPATVAVRNLARKAKAAPRNAGAWSMPGYPKIVVVDCPEFAAPTLRNSRSDLPASSADD
ncbi:hypothetical protein ACLNGM_21675 [Aureimonas phyllosphaerae]|uniref:hypothetical protein n=1 Tax=Aureimonas phyllosphaerae TaxID=1166078 RepID=UPI003A5C4CAF